MPNRSIKGSQERQGLIGRDSINEEKRTVEIAFSSETPVSRWFGDEVLLHDADSVRLGRMQNGGALLVGHNHDDQVGVIESVSIDSDKRGRAVVRFGRSARAEEIYQDVIDGIRKHISVGYTIHKYEVTERDGMQDEVRVTDWEPNEISIVSVPADASVGVGRSIKTEDFKMTDKKTESPAQERSENVDVDKLNAEAVSAERSRISDIERAYEDAPKGFSLDGLKREAIDKGLTADQFRAKAFQSMAGQAPAQAPKAPGAELLNTEKREYSLSRAIMAQLDGDWSNAGYEREMSQELTRQGGSKAGGLMVPGDVLVGKRASDMTTAAGLVGTEHRPGDFIDTLRAMTVLGRANSRFLPGLTGNLSIPKKTANAQFGWKAEGVDADSSDVTVGNVPLSGKHISGVVPITFELIRNSSPAIEGIVREDMLTGIALAIDAAGLNGTGTNDQPLGILNTAGVATVTAADTAGKVPTWSEVVDLEGEIDTANALMGSLGYILHPGINSKLKTTAKDSGSGLFVVEGGQCNGYSALSSTQMPAKGSLFGNFNDLMVGLWGAVELIPFRNPKTGGLEIGCHQMADIAVRHPESFAKIV